MSQKKVDAYKKEKANRKKEVKKAKVKRVFTKIIVVVLALAIVGYIGWSVYDKFIKKAPSSQEGETTTLSSEQLSSLQDAISIQAAQSSGSETTSGTNSNEEGSDNETTSGNDSSEKKSEENTSDKQNTAAGEESTSKANESNSDTTKNTAKEASSETTKAQ